MSDNDPINGPPLIGRPTYTRSFTLKAQVAQRDQGICVDCERLAQPQPTHQPTHQPTDDDDDSNQPDSTSTFPIYQHPPGQWLAVHTSPTKTPFQRRQAETLDNLETVCLIHFEARKHPEVPLSIATLTLPPLVRKAQQTKALNAKYANSSMRHDPNRPHPDNRTLISFHIHADLHLQIKDAAAAQGISASALYRKLITEAFTGASPAPRNDDPRDDPHSPLRPLTPHSSPLNPPSYAPRTSAARQPPVYFDDPLPAPTTTPTTPQFLSERDRDAQRQTVPLYEPDFDPHDLTDHQIDQLTQNEIAQILSAHPDPELDARINRVIAESAAAFSTNPTPTAHPAHLDSQSLSPVSSKP